jgi:hypothetical protein
MPGRESRESLLARRERRLTTSRELSLENDGTAARVCIASPDGRSGFFKASLKSCHRQDAKNAKNGLPIRLFSVISVLSVAPW